MPTSLARLGVHSVTGSTTLNTKSMNQPQLVESSASFYYWLLDLDTIDTLLLPFFPHNHSQLVTKEEETSSLGLQRRTFHYLLLTTLFNLVSTRTRDLPSSPPSPSSKELAKFVAFPSPLPQHLPLRHDNNAFPIHLKLCFGSGREHVV